MPEVLEIDTTVYSVESVKEALYRFSDSFSSNLTHNDNLLRVEITLTNGNADWNKLRTEFDKELLDQSLRERIRAETEDIRRVILAHAFSNTSIID